MICLDECVALGLRMIFVSGNGFEEGSRQASRLGNCRRGSSGCPNPGPSGPIVWRRSASTSRIFLHRYCISYMSERELKRSIRTAMQLGDLIAVRMLCWVSAVVLYVVHKMFRPQTSRVSSSNHEANLARTSPSSASVLG